MPSIGDIIVIAVLGVVVFFVIRKLYKQHKNSGCGGDCCNCSKCKH